MTDCELCTSSLLRAIIGTFVANVATLVLLLIVWCIYSRQKRRKLIKISSQEVLAEREEIDDNTATETATASTAKGSFLIRLIQYHYGDTKCVKSAKQISRESKLLPGVPFNRWCLMPAAIIIQFCCGSLYAWSVFNIPIDELIYGHVENMSPITFYIAVGFFGLSAALMGPWLERNGPLISCLLGTSLFFAGNLLAALSLYLQQIWLVFVGYGMVSGFGLGLCYISPVSALQKWFPDRRGLASGMAVCGFGAGSIVIAKVQLPLITSVGLPMTFVILGSSYFVLMTLSGLVLRTPPPNYVVDSNQNSEVKDLPNGSNPKDAEIGDLDNQVDQEIVPESINLIDALTSVDFRLMYAMFLANAIFGLVVISRLSNMVTDIFGRTREEASTVVSINGGFNLGGRLFFSILSDYIGRKNCYLVMLTSQLIILGSFSTITTTKTYWAFKMTMWILTSCYGAGFGVIPAFLSDRFGPSNIGACHGVILTAWSFAGVVGGLIFTSIFNSILRSGYTSKDAYPYNINGWWIFVVVFIGWLTLLFVSPTLKDKAFTRKPRELIRRAFNRITNRERSFEMN